MKAITYHHYGEPEVLAVEEHPDPVAGERELLIRVRAAEATKADCEFRAFRYSVQWFWLPLRLAAGVRSPRRTIIGGYFAGEVVSVGSEVEGFAPGDEVYGSTGPRFGAYGELVALPAKAAIAPKPTTMTFAEAAAVPLGGLNGLHFMRRAEVAPGERVLVNGAGGVIGAHAVQIARSMGAEVTGVDHGRKEEFVRRLGAVDFIDYTTTDVTTTGQRFDVVFDMVPGSSYAGLVRMLEPGGRYLSGNPRLATMVRCLLTSWTSDKTARFAFAQETREELRTLTSMVEGGEIEPIVDRVLPMEAAPEAHRLVESEERIGAIVLAIEP